MVVLPYDTVGCGEASSPNDVIEVVIVMKTKTPAGEAGVVWRSFTGLEQIEFFGAADGRPTVIGA